MESSASATLVQPELFPKTREEMQLEASETLPWETAAAEDCLAAQVVVNRPIDKAFSYLIPDHLREEIQPGQRVRVPFGRGDRHTTGFCVDVGPVPQTDRELKWVQSVIDELPLITPSMLDLTRWIADRYLCSWGQVLDSVVPTGVKQRAGTRLIRRFQIHPDAQTRLEGIRLSAKQQAVLAVLQQSETPLTLEEITVAASCSAGPVQALVKKNLVTALRERTHDFEPESPPVERNDDLKLNEQQHAALTAIVESLQQKQHQTFLLHGVTGSGKTEVYIQAIREVVGYGRQAIVLVPEISLTPQTVQRFQSRFDSVAVLHSHLSAAERHWHWQQIRRGAVNVIVGARSAVFAPAPHLGLIVIDEEHETSFKQDSTPRYHTREVARERARLEQIPLVLGSATPTLESWHRGQTKKDVVLALPKRVEERAMPPVIVVDTRNDPQVQRGESIGRVLESGMRTALADSGQVILFLNLRGFSPTLWCRACGVSAKCPHCDVTLTWHRDRNVALCHVCNHQAILRSCPECGHAGIRRLGSGTQRLEEEVRRKFPEHNILRMDSDSMRRHGSYSAALEAFRNGEVQILLGTQMIAKGLDFPNVTLVGVVDADTSLHQPDLRAAERTFQLISQVAGRTGRSHRGGRVFVQTSSPGEPAIAFAADHDYHGFARHEMRQRQAMHVPPFRHLARVILRSEDEALVEARADEFAEVLKQVIQEESLPIWLLGPAPAPVAKLKDQYRYHFQLSACDPANIVKLWRIAEERLPKSSGVEYVIDVDPMNMR